MIDPDRTFHRLMAATRKTKAEDRNAREALAQDTISIPALPLSVAAFRGAKKCNPYLRKVLLGQGEWPVALRDTPDPFSPALRKTHPLANTLKPGDIVRPKIGVESYLATRPSILAGESSVTSSITEV